jgi:SAM-dependent methyltransferase
MDEITRRVRSMYEMYPYPPGEIGVRADCAPRLLLSYLAGGPPDGRPLRILDAGCGTGASAIAVAMYEPQAEVTAVDINPTALRMLREEAARRDLKNLSIHEVDLMTLEGLEVPEAGFDVIHSSGVLHHLSDPAKGLSNLARVLAPQGVIALMVYGRYGRQPLERLVEALDLARGHDEPIGQRLAFARALVQALGESPATRPPWNDATTISDIEFVDRYLHVQFVNQSVEELFGLLSDARLRHLRWLEPRDWSVRELLGASELVEGLERLPELVQYQVVERLADRMNLELVACHRDASSRPPWRPEDLPTLRVEWNPQAALDSRKWRIGGRELIEVSLIQLRVRKSPTPRIFTGIHAALMHMYVGACTGEELVNAALAEVECSKETAFEALRELIELEIFYVP